MDPKKRSYLDPKYNPIQDSMHKLKEILTLNNVHYSHNSKKKDLIELFERYISPRLQKLRDQEIEKFREEEKAGKSKSIISDFMQAANSDEPSFQKFYDISGGWDLGLLDSKSLPIWDTILWAASIIMIAFTEATYLEFANRTSVTFII
ncbi:17378_t:CDS:2 [Entrophospora sp. SA101]|nr:17378_t:CDS:2 [Entrophospora sp. SA101]